MRGKSPKAIILVGLTSILFSGSALAQDPDIEALRTAVNELRSDYEARISELERRLAVAEQNSTQASLAAQRVEAAAIPPPNNSSSNNSAFNPAIGVIFEGYAWHSSGDYGVPGYPTGGEAGPIAQGFSIGETEINISANVDDKFTAWLTTPVVIEDGEAGIEVEEAWVETTALPAGLSSRFGRFFSSIGYLNQKHAHSWDFVDQPLPYLAFLGGQYLDDGIQLRWIAPTNLYMEFGGEVFNGGRYPAVGSANSGVGSYSVFANIGGDVGSGSSWLAGLSYLDASAIDRPSGSEDSPLLFTGDSDLLIAHFVWKWAPNNNWKQKNLVVQAEYLWRNEEGEYLLPDGMLSAYDNDQRGWYAQMTYQPFPRWRFGGRVDGLSSGDPGPNYIGTPLDPMGDDPVRYSLMADWSNSEFSRLRFQFTRDNAGISDDSQWGFQYIHSIGAHGAHSF